MSTTFFTKLERYVPNLSEYLNRGATAKKIAKLERVTGYNFPDTFKAFYLVHNGEKDDLGLFFGLHWLGIEDILSHWTNNKEYNEDFSGIDVISFEKDKIREAYFHPGWIPIAYDYGGNYIGIDFLPGKNGKVGQIINFGGDEHELFVISNSFEELIELLIKHFECGNCKLITEEEEPYISWKEDGHFFDDLKEICAVNADNDAKDMSEEISLEELEDKWKRVLKNHLGFEPKSARDLHKIKTLRLLHSNIVDLSPLNYFVGLRELIASGLNITNFKPIACLIELKRLYLAKTPLTDLSDFKSLKELKQLSIGNSSVQDLSALTELPLLEDLSLENLRIKDLSPLARCKKLKILDVSGIQTEDITEIKKLTKLTELDITRVKLKSLSILEGMTKLESLKFEEPEDGDYTILKSLKNIESLTCSFAAFMATKEMFDEEIEYTIMGEISESEEQIYINYAMGR